MFLGAKIRLEIDTPDKECYIYIEKVKKIYC